MEKNIEKIMEDMKILMDVKRIVEETNEKLGPMNQRIEKLEEENGKLWMEMENVKAENLHLRLRLDQLEQYSRKTNLIIYGIPFKEEENISELIKSLATALKVSYSSSDIVACHRFPNNKRNTPPLIVRFVNHTTKEE